jgi:DNA (cytosine-5)-methyltransferase 1
MRALDLYAGAGGWTCAAAELGIDEDTCELMPQANATRYAAHGSKATFTNAWAPPQNIDGEFYDGIIASPPCQEFSLAGSGKKAHGAREVLRALDREAYTQWRALKLLAMVYGERFALVLTPMTYVHMLQPQWTVWEQVPTVLPVWEECARKLKTIGYSTWTGVLDAETYGVPQTRSRAILIASRATTVNKPPATHSRYYPRTPTKMDPGVLPWVSMAQALGWDNEDRIGWARRADGIGDEMLHGQQIRSRDLRDASEPSFVVTEKTRSWQRHIRVTNDRPNATLRNETQPAPTLAFGHEKPAWVYKRPSTTVVGTFRPDTIAAPDYRNSGPRQDAPNSVRVTIAEAGVLQSFPADYPWRGSATKQYLQVGNAIPPLMAQAILKEATGG